MAIMQYGSGSSGNTTANGIAVSFQELPWLNITTRTSTFLTGDYRYLGSSGISDSFYGYGFSYDSLGSPTSGVITEIKRTSGGQASADLTNIAIPVSQLNYWLIYGLYTTAGQTIFGGNDIFYGTTGNEILQGWGGTDTYYPGTGRDQVIGGSGIDTVGLPAYAHYATVTNPRSISTLTPGSVRAGDVNVTLQAVDRLRFVDGTRYYDPDSPAAQVVRMYDTALGRLPDPSGLAGWTNALGAGMSLTQMAQGFIGSAEFQARYPGVSQSPEAFVTQLYQNTLGRLPDPAGFAAWTNALRSGAVSQAALVVGFSQSPEHAAKMSSVTNGVFVADETCATVARLYYTVLGRGPDVPGLNMWTNKAETGVQTLTQVAASFLTSREFDQGLSAGDFVDLLYKNALGRVPDAGGAGWTAAIASGAVSRADAALGFANSTEAMTRLQSIVDVDGVIFG